MSKHKKAHRTYPDGGKQHKKALQEKQMNERIDRQNAKPHRLVTAESVRAGHPDKICDQIADAILDAHLRQDKNARVAVEVMATDGKIVIAGEVSSAAQVNYHKIVYEQLSHIGCGYGDLTNNRAVPFEIDIRIHEQSPDINGAVAHEPVYELGGTVSPADTVGAGDKGIMVGYATNETERRPRGRHRSNRAQAGGGPVAHFGGGAMSGKDPTKVDRTGAYAARWVAKNIVAAGLASRCEVQIAYAIGMTEPIIVSIETFGTGKVSADVPARAVQKVFDLRTGALIETLHLRENRYAPLAVYGHFGHGKILYAWERTDRVEELLAAVKES